MAGHPAAHHHDRRRRPAPRPGVAGVQAAPGARGHHRHRRHFGGCAGHRVVAVGRRAAARRPYLCEAGRRHGRLQRLHRHAGRHRHAAQRAGGRRLPAPGGHGGRRVPRAGHGVGLRRHVDGHGQRPDHHLPGPRDPLHRPVRADRLQLQARHLGRGRPQVLHPRRLLVGHLHLRHCADLRRHRVDQPDPDFGLPVQERRPDQRPAAGRPRPHDRRLRLQGGGGAVPHVDARRLPGRPVAGHGLHGGRGQSRRLRRHAARPLLLLRGRRDRLAPDRLRLGRAVAGPRRLRGPAPARREADAGLLVDQPRRLHSAGGGGRHGPWRQRLALLPLRLHVHDRGQLRHRDGARARGRHRPRPVPLPGSGRPPTRAGAGVRRAAAGPGGSAVHHRVVGQAAGGLRRGRCGRGATGGHRHGERRRGGLLLPAGRRPHVRRRRSRRDRRRHRRLGRAGRRRRHDRGQPHHGGRTGRTGGGQQHRRQRPTATPQQAGWPGPPRPRPPAP